MVKPGYKCIYCGGEEFFEGPSGGAAINVLCANVRCRHWFNDIFGEIQDLHKVEPLNDDIRAALKEKGSG